MTFKRLISTFLTVSIIAFFVPNNYVYASELSEDCTSEIPDSPEVIESDTIDDTDNNDDADTNEDTDNTDDTDNTELESDESSTDEELEDDMSDADTELAEYITDSDLNYSYQELVDEETGISIKGPFPENATLQVTSSDIPTAIMDRITALYSQYDIELDSCDTEFIDTCVELKILDADGNEYDALDSDKDVLVTIPVSEVSMEMIGSNKYTVLAGDESELPHSFDKEDATIQFLTKDLSRVITVLGTQTHYFYTVRFEVLSTTEDDFEFSTEYRAERGDSIEPPTFYSSAYPKLEQLTWDDVDETVECDMTFTNYIDSTKYVADKGDSIDDSEFEVESYGEKLSTDDEYALEESDSDSDSTSEESDDDPDEIEVALKEDMILPESSDSDVDVPIED